MTDLLIDAGNSRIKYRLEKEGDMLESGVCVATNWMQLFRSLSQEADTAYISFVGQDAQRDLLATCLAGQMPGIWITHDMVTGLFPRFQPAYAELNTLGLDRLLAMIAARILDKRDGKRIVVDAGTALTLDIMDNWRHMGGFIVPGAGLQMASLHQSAALKQVAILAEELAVNEPGKTTDECIRHGVAAQLSALINTTVSANPDARLFITGGDAQWLIPVLNTAPLARDNLVLDGISLLIREREK